MRRIGALLLVLPLAGCGGGIAAKIEARNDYRASVDKYKQCLAENAATPQKCEGLRLAMESDERKSTNMSAALNENAVRSSNITVQGR
jgi:hypothetical protein